MSTPVQVSANTTPARHCHWCGVIMLGCNDTAAHMVPFMRCNNINECHGRCDLQQKSWPPQPNEWAHQMGDIVFT